MSTLCDLLWTEEKNFSIMFLKRATLFAVLLLCVEHAVAQQARTTLATFSPHLDPLYHGLTGDPEIPARTSLLIQQVSQSAP